MTNHGITSTPSFLGPAPNDDLASVYLSRRKTRRERDITAQEPLISVTHSLTLLATFQTGLHFPSCLGAPQAYLRLRQAQPAGQLLPLRSDHIVVLLEGSFQSEQLRGRERRPDAFGFPGERAVQEKVLRTVVLPWNPQTNTSTVIPAVFTETCSVSCHQVSDTLATALIVTSSKQR